MDRLGREVSAPWNLTRDCPDYRGTVIRGLISNRLYVTEAPGKLSGVIMARRFVHEVKANSFWSL